MRSGKSFVAHLTGMCAALEYEEEALEINKLVQKWLSGNRTINKPRAVSVNRGDLTIAYVHSAADAEDHLKRVREWARLTWSAWSEHHFRARELISEATAAVSR